ncbi:alpha/beta-hydrolase [Rhodofomes roseus]|uniref:Dipeptidyl-peptidase V n=1 Tax=Rhodofomes roseus TaxID=34475 RepID=A0ABQ8KNB7_9APHY|nr:alpha/beta-hydrolase [Rhodofomes roseus]KAH9839909.1 alpha/beta-hydrolase [Rhodofomes roseus]
MSDSSEARPGRITPEEIARTDSIHSPKLSQDGAYVVYCVGPNFRTGDHSTTALWVAETSVENSARKITSGDKHDYAPSFHPSSGLIYFLSDREKAGGPAKLYSIPVDATVETDASLVFTLEEYQNFTSYDISPDGNYIAFTSAKKDEQDTKTKVFKIWREKTGLASLYVADLRHLHETPRVLVKTDEHVHSFSWSADSRSILYRLSDYADEECLRGQPIREAVVDIHSGITRDEFLHPRNPSSASVWRERGDIVFLQNTTPGCFFSAQSLWARPSPVAATAHVKYGENDGTLMIVDLRKDSQYAVAVARGLGTIVDVFDVNHKASTIYATQDDQISGLDIKAISKGRYCFVILRSSAVRGEPLEVWFGSADETTGGKVTHKLSSHNIWLPQERMPVSRPCYWISPDGQDVQGVISHPRGADLKAMPTVVAIHGGPTDRDSLDLTFHFLSWRLFLASQGYLVLSPNYRGSIGRGDAFVKHANGGMGTTDWMDVQSMVDQSIAEGLVDPSRVVIVGYSQGGFLTAWGVSRPNSIFKAGVDGAGVTDWGMLAATSDVPDLEAALCGGATWTPEDTSFLRGSPIRDSKNVNVPLLLLHGEQDKRVPVTQAIAFLRGVERVGQPSSKPMLVVYPREDHIFQERTHVEDVYRRLAEHVESFL